MKKMLAFFSINLKEAFTYRARSFIWFLTDAFPILTTLLFFSAVFSERSFVGAYSFNSMLIYYLITLSLNVLIISHPEFGISQHINQGFLSVFLIKPLSYLKFWLTNEAAYKIVRLIYLIPCLLVLFKLFPFTPAILNLSIWEIIALLLITVFSFNIYFLLKVIIGFAAFWFTEIYWLIATWELVNLLFSGILIPIDLMPKSFQGIAAVLPFKYLIYVPARIVLGKSSPKEIITSLLVQFLWIAVLTILSRQIWRKGVKIYSAFGG